MQCSITKYVVYGGGQRHLAAHAWYILCVAGTDIERGWGELGSIPAPRASKRSLVDLAAHNAFECTSWECVVCCQLQPLFVCFSHNMASCSLFVNRNPFRVYFRCVYVL
jgi:hypothetical protein